MANSAPRLVKVYDKKGNEYTVSHLNAHDMVRHLGYTYRPGHTFRPNDPAPFDVKPATSASEKKKVQAILDGVGTDYNSRTDEDDDEDDDTPAVFDATDTGPAITTELPVTAEEDTPTAPAPAAVEELPPVEADEAPKRGRGRPKAS